MKKLLLPALLLVTACEFPTGPPRLESRFLLPLEETRVSAGELLPAGVTIAGGAFRISVAAVGAQRTLGQLCGAPCTQRQGQFAPKPAFVHTLTQPLGFPPDVSGGTITGGTAQVTLTHNFDFDPLQPPGSTAQGSIVLSVRSAGVTLGSTTIQQPFPRNTTISRGIPLSGPVAGGAELVVTTTSPAGGTVLINNAAVLTISMAPLAATASEARVTVQNRGISAQPVTLDLRGVDEGIRDRVVSGALVLAVTNPFNVAGTLQMRLQAPGSGADFQRTVQITPAASSQRIELTREELQSLLGQNVTVTVAGPVSGVGGPITLRPDQRLILSPRLDLVLEIGA